MLIDLFGYYERRSKTMKPFEIKKAMKELERIEILLQKALKSKEAV